MRIERDQIRTLAVVGALTAAFMGLLWLPNHNQKQRLTERIEQAKNQLESDKAVTVMLPALARELSQLKQQLSTSNKQIPKSDGISELLRQLSGDLQNQQAIDQEIQTQPIVAGADYSVVPVTLSFKGSCPAVFDFVRKVEAGRRLVRITRLSLHNDLSKPTEPLKARIELCTFFSAAK